MSVGITEIGLLNTGIYLMLLGDTDPNIGWRYTYSGFRYYDYYDVEVNYHQIVAKDN